MLKLRLTIALVSGLLPVAGQAPSLSRFAPQVVSYRVDPRRSTLRLYYCDAQGRRYGSLGGLRAGLAGLFTENGKTLMPLDTAAGTGNFYLKPNGVFYLGTDRSAHIVPTAAFRPDGRVAYATQSGPMLVLDGQIHPAFRPGSANVQVRNGVGILPDGRVLLAMSRTKISFYDFAQYFRRAGCRQALYLDGFVSRTYAPAAGWTQLDGDFGVIIGVSEPMPPPSILPPGKQHKPQWQ